MILCHCYDGNECEAGKGSWSVPFGPTVITQLQTRTPLHQIDLKQVCNSGHLHYCAFSSCYQTIMYGLLHAVGREEHKVSWGTA